MGKHVSYKFDQDPNDGTNFAMLTLTKEETTSDVTFTFEKEEAELMAEYFEALAERIDLR